ncbi:helix-turn-helix domain-containing protein [Trinickia sp.]|uniref:helix-turn-helix domain-containing protein n=1 Tax=Trinickia sp. TaxID=2571163 RepID=UPI003F7E8EC1
MRAPLASIDGRRPHSRLYLAPPGLQGAMLALVCRDTTGFALTDAQRLSHFPASPLVCLSWFDGVDAGIVECNAGHTVWRPYESAFMLSGSQARPMVSWGRESGRGGMICFEADAARALFDLDLSAIQDRIVPAEPLLGPAWQPFLDALLAADSDAMALCVLERHLAARWRALTGRDSVLAPLREAGRYWVERLAWQAHEWRRTHGSRQVERRIKAYSGRSLREWQSLVKTESLFFSARDRFESGQALDWAALAQDEGFADQAHLSRAVKRTTGFSPSEFTQRFLEDESFWAYRLWV